MSIKALHIFLIASAIALSALFGVWAFDYAQKTADSIYQAGGILSLLIAVGLLFYAVYFVKKAKSLS